MVSLTRYPRHWPILSINHQPNIMQFVAPQRSSTPTNFPLIFNQSAASQKLKSRWPSIFIKLAHKYPPWNHQPASNHGIHFQHQQETHQDHPSRHLHSTTTTDTVVPPG